MAEPKRRPGHLREAILRVLRDHPLPLSGLQLARILGGERHMVAPSMVFREIRRLIDRGTIRKIFVARAYAPASEDFAIALSCSRCGKLCETASAETLEALDNAAAALGFGVSRYIVEVSGLCRDCSEWPDTPGSDVA